MRSIAPRSSAGFALCLATAAAAAQGPPPGTPPGNPWSDAMVAESLVVLRQLDAAVHRDPKNAATWHRRGMIGWGLMYRARIGPAYNGLDWTLLGRMADTSLRIARQIDGENPRYTLAAAQFYLGTGPMTTRVQAYGMLSRALREARVGTDSALLSEALIEVGRTSWRRYDALANRRIAGDDGDLVRTLQNYTDAREAGQLPFQRDELIANINRMTQPLGGAFSGESHYLTASDLFHEAYDVMPTSARAFRHVAMALADGRRWSELAQHARTHLTRAPRDPNGLMSLGLALHRMRRSGEAEVAFDSALAALSPNELAHVTSLRRVLSPDHAKAYTTLTTAERDAQDRMYWAVNAPLWTRGRNDPRTEFFARVAYADIRWTVEELGVRGIDSDRGEFHIRFGPPDVEAQLGPAPPGAGSATNLDAESQMGLTSIATLWAYRSGTLIVFRGAATYATARIPPSDQARIDSIVRARPADWSNVAEGRIDVMPTQVARFRATRDSVDVFIVTEPPIDALQRTSASNARLRTDLWLFDGVSDAFFRDSVVASRASAHSWLFRLPPSTFGYRVEATADGALLAGRASALVDSRDAGPEAFARLGFGMSDLLLASRVTDPGAVRRWNHLDFAPIGETIAYRGSVILIWENYSLGDTDGQAKYGVTLTIRRRHEATLARIRSRIVGAMAATFGIEETEDRVIHRIERAMPHSSILVDHLTVDLQDSPRGEYFLTLHITDRATGRVTERERRIVIR